jgi:CheY-like chemotaxis protein
LAERAADKSVLLELHLADDLPGFVVGDPTRLRQVLVNLVGNALKFTDRGSVSVGIYLVSRKGTVSQVRFDVKDSGIGMSPEALSRMFQKFEQADTSTTRRYGGTGLGLAITKQLVELMGGHIGVTSTLGVGSTFSFELPMPDGQEVQEHAELDMAPHSHRLRVLCAEDFPTNQIIIRTLLEEMGHEVHVVENGRLAVHALAQGSFDLVLMDGRMPEMDGAEATRAIRAGGLPGMAVHAVDIPIIALTANATEEDRQHYLACGMDDFLSKPIDESALHALLARQIEALLAQSVALPLRDAQPAESPPPSPSAASLDALFGVSEEGGAAGLELEATSGASQPDWGQAAELSLVAEEPSPAPAKFDLKTRMRQAFSKDLPQRWAELAAAAQRRDAAHAARLFHGFKGSVAYIEPGGVAYHLCSELEHAADHADWPRIDSQLDKLHALMQTWWPQ